MTTALILGGTGWLSGRIAQTLVDSGAEVTCLARGGRPAPEGTVLVEGDRDASDAYAQLATRHWDRVIDISSNARHVAAAVAALGEQAARWTYVSSVSVYSDDVTVGADESAPTHPAAQPDDEYAYGQQKVAAEDAVGVLGDRALIVRPGLVVGVGDQSDRFGYWAAAFDRAGVGAVLLPPIAERITQIIDVDDLASYVATASISGAVNAVGQQHPLAEVLDVVQRAAGQAGDTVVADDGWLSEHSVAHWTGERSLPLWLPAEMTGFMTRSNAAYVASGGTLRPLVDTVSAVLDDERVRGVNRDRKAGLTRAAEEELIAELR